MSRSYGVLRVVRVRLPVVANTQEQGKYPTGWLPEENLVHVLTRRETTIGRALNNDIVLLDPTVSREHARLVLDVDGWSIHNLTGQNVVRVNGQQLSGEETTQIRSQDIIILGGTMLQFIAPMVSATEIAEEGNEGPDRALYADQQTMQLQRLKTPNNGTTSEQAPPDLAAPRSSEPPQELGPARPIASISVNQGIPSDPHLVTPTWTAEEAESLLGAGVTMQFVLPQRLGRRTRWLIAGVALTILAICAIITVVLNSIVGISVFDQNGASSLVAAATIPLIPTVGIFCLVNFIDRYEREPWFLRLAAFLWGMVIAIPSALFIEQSIDNMLLNLLQPGTSDVLRSVLQGLNAGFTEETVKGLGLLLLFIVLRDEFDNVTDGIVYAAMIGAGFALVENFSYFAFNYKNSLIFLVIYRVVLGWLGHPTFTACFGAPLGYTRHTRSRWGQIMAPLLGYLAAVLLHSFFDFIVYQADKSIQADPENSSVATLALLAIIGDYIPPFLAQMTLLYFLIRSLAHEAAVIREFLAVEVSSGIVTVDEYALLQNSFHRTRKERQVLYHRGYKQWLRVKALYQTEIGLAFRKWHVSMGDKQKQGYLRQPEDAYRERIRHLRNQMQAADAPAVPLQAK